MLTPFENVTCKHTVGPLRPGNAAMQVISQADFAMARGEIVTWHGYAPTPLVELNSLAKALGLNQILYKHEGPRFGLGSFKALGGSYAALQVLRREVSKAVGHNVSLADITNTKFPDAAANVTITSATDGNHGRAVAWGAKRFGARCRIYIHAEVSEGRAEAMRNLGADVVRIDGDYDASVAVTRQEAEANGWHVVSDTSWTGYTETPRHVMAGYGVMAYEICQELDQPPTHVFLQGGVGGLAAAIAAAFRQHWEDESPRVVVVEPELAPCLYASAKAGTAKAVQILEETLMAGLSCGEPSKIAWDILVEEASDFMTVPESVVAPAVRLMARPLGNDPALEVGESAIAGLAGLICAAQQTELRTRMEIDETFTALLIGSEGVTDPAIFRDIMAQES